MAIFGTPTPEDWARGLGSPGWGGSRAWGAPSSGVGGGGQFAQPGTQMGAPPVPVQATGIDGGPAVQAIPQVQATGIDGGPTMSAASTLPTDGQTGVARYGGLQYGTGDQMGMAAATPYGTQAASSAGALPAGTAGSGAVPIGPPDGALRSMLPRR